MDSARISGLLGIALVVVIGCSLWGSELALADGPPVQWQKTFGGSEYDMGSSVQQTSDGGYIIAGATSSFGAGDIDVYLIKTEPNGHSQWQKTFGGSDNDFGNSVQQTSDGGYVIAGYTNFSVVRRTDVYIIKTEPNGSSQWHKTFGGSDSDYGRSVQQTSDGGYIIAGDTSSFGAGGFDVSLIKTEPNGSSQWQKTFGGSDFDMCSSVQQTSDGGYVIAGSTYSFGAGGSDVYLIKTEPNGNSQWEKTFGGNDDDGGYSVQQTADDGYIIAGYTDSFGAGDIDVYLIKTKPNGSSEWQKSFGGNEYDRGFSVQQTSSGGYIIAGYTNSFGAGDYDVYLIKTDPNGSSEWEKTIGASKDDNGYSVQQTGDGGYIIAGATLSVGTGLMEYIYLIKLCSEGTLSGDLNCDGTVNYEDVEILVRQWLQPRSILDPHADIYGVGDGITNFKDFSIIANQLLTTDPRIPDDMVYIPDGEFEMGDHHDGMINALPTHTVTLGSFYMSKYEITNQQYCDYLNSAYPAQIKVVSGTVFAADDTGNSYPYCETSISSSYSQINFSDPDFSVNIKDGTTDMSDHPMVQVSWYGCVAFCNWKSQQEGLEGCYDLLTWDCDFTKNGFRLATEAEWEYAARGGNQSPYYRYPWGDTFDGSMANYWVSGDPYETGAYPWTTPVGYYDGGQTPAGTDMANGYGLYDVAGNVWEWCNDWYGSYSSSPQTNPTGPASGSYRVLRGGCWYYYGDDCRVAFRSYTNPSIRYRNFGFRVCVFTSSQD